MTVRLDKNYEPLPGYRLIERLGRGGFGEVWKVEAPGQLFKAMKFVFGNLDSQDDDGRPAEQELKALNRVKAIRHPYILSLERIDIIDGQLLIVMELADCSLWDRFREYRQQKKPGIPREELLMYMAEAAEALDLMNEQYHIQHLDVKPQNLFLLYNHIKVADFGLAKAFEGGRGTITGGVTPVYAAPETFEGYASRFTDQYSLAICIQELLTGTRPFNGSNTKQLLMQHLNGVPDLTALPAGDKPILARALAKKPDDRWPNCQAMVQALRSSHLVDTPVPVSLQSPSIPSPMVSTPTMMQYSKVLTTPKSEFSDAQRTRLVTPELKTIRPNGGDTSTRPALKLVTAHAAAAAATGRNNPVLSPRLLTRGTAPLSDLKSKIVIPAEINEKGSLIPTLLVGVGHHGRLVLQQLKSLLQQEYGSLNRLPHLQFLLIDTDGDELSEATRQESEGQLSGSETYHARLNRSAHYLQRDGLPSVEAWMPHGHLFQLPRDPRNTFGQRSFGRLAFLDHARPLRKVFQQIIENFAKDEPLKKAAADTGHGIRTNRPRAYVISSTSGGTGSGMAIDLAYFLKNEFRKVGFQKTHIRGVFFVPPADKTKPKSTALANSFAFLEELKFFTSPGTIYHTRFDTSENPLSEGDGPFDTCQLVQLADQPVSSRLKSIIGGTARQIVLELLSPLGRVTDTVREEALSLPRENSPVVQASSFFRFTWPRKALLESVRARFGARLLSRWAIKDATALREPIRNWLSQEWTKREMDLEQFVEKLNAALFEVLREKPERVFNAFVDPLEISYQNGGKFNEASAFSVFEELVKLVGGPDAESDTLGKLEETLRTRAKMIGIESEGNLSALAVSFIEQPQYRLAGAEEALQQIADKLTLTIEALENIRKGLIREVNETYNRLYTVMKQLTNDEIGLFRSRKSTLMMEMCSHFRKYANQRLNLSVVLTSLSYYRSLQSQCPEYSREIANCRQRLNELSNAILTSERVVSMNEPVMPILPAGCDSIEATADELINQLNPETLLAFESDLQKAIVRKLRGVVSVTTKSELSTDFLKLLEAKTLEFLEPQIETANPAEIFFRYMAEQPNIAATISEAFDLAAPDLTSISGAAPAEATILAAPGGDSGERLNSFLTQTLEGIEFIPAELDSDIVIYREYPLLEMSSLPQMAQHAFDAYQHFSNTENRPHARYDIHWSPHVM